MNRRKVWLAISLVGCLPLGIAHAQNINGLVNNPYVSFGRPDSTLVMTNSNSINPGSASISDSFTPGVSGVNRHDVLLSSDNGATAHTFGIDDSFTFTTLVNLADLNNSPRKEAGIRINSSTTGDALFIINSDAGEIVAFGGGAPFYLFGNNAGSNGYTPGTTILLGITEQGGGDGVGGNANTITYFIDRDPFNPGGEASSGPLAWSNLELGPVSYNVGVYGQGAPPANAADSFTVTYTNMTFTTIVPEPASLGLSLLGAIVFAQVRRRRPQ
jgi:hypothetical protein